MSEKINENNNYEKVMEYIKEEERKEKNHNRRYYRHNISLEYLQKQNVPVEFQYLKSGFGYEKEFDEPLDFIDLIKNPELVKALKILKQLDIRVIELKYRLGFSLYEISLKLGIKYDATKKIHIRALAKLKKFLDKT
ncbi:UNVERIFIED_ORG: hypothetical protein B2H93_07945 [Clostridium botulinum]